MEVKYAFDIGRVGRGMRSGQRIRYECVILSPQHEGMSGILAL